MKVLFIIDTLTAGGKERRLTELMKALRKLTDIDFELAVMSNDIHYNEVFDLNIRIHYLIRKCRKDFSVFVRFYRLCKSYKPDIVHCWESMAAVYVTPACILLKLKLVNGMVVDTLVRQNIFDQSFLRARLTFPFSDVIVGNSIAGLNSYKAPGGKSVCIYNGIDLSRLGRIKEASEVIKELTGDNSADYLILGMVAAFASRKDYRTLIKVSVGLMESNENIRFILIGDGPEFDEIRNSIPESLKNRIIMPGKRSDVDSIVNIFDIGILLTNSKAHGEGISNSIIEYMAFGKPVIATRGGGTGEIVINNQTGFLIDPEDEGQLKEKICLLLEDKGLIYRLGQEGKKLIQEKFSIEIMTKNYVALYEKLIGL